MMTDSSQTAVLFVCLGNICRSPTAEGVFRGLVTKQNRADAFYIDSAGTAAYHLGAAPDKRTTAAAAKRGYDLSGLRGRQVTVADFERFDHVLAMDKENLRNLQNLCPAGLEHKVELFLNYAKKHQASEVPDPYYGGAQGFEDVLDLVEDAATGLLEHLLAV